MSSELTGKKQYLETVKYMGDLRIIGQIVENLTSKVVLGYVIMTEKTKKMKAYNIAQTKWLMSRYKFSNAKLDGDKIVNTECAMDRLMKFNKNVAPLETNKSMIIGKIMLDGKPNGFRILSPKGTIVDLKEDEVLALNTKGIEFVNAKFVTKSQGSKPYISAIKQEFTLIEQKELKDKLRELNKNAGKYYRYTRKIEKIIKNSSAMRLSLVNMNFRYIANASELKLNNKSWDKQNKGKIMEIMVKECIPAYYKENVPEEKKQLAVRIVKAYKDGELKKVTKGYNDYREDDEAEIALLLLSQVLTDDKVLELKDKDIKKHKWLYEYNGEKYLNKLISRLKKLDDLELITVNTKLSMIKVINYVRDLDTKKKGIYRGKLPVTYAKFKPDREFASASTITNLGFSVSKKSNRFFTLDTENGAKLLRYLVDYIPNYERYLTKATCLGDLLILAKIERVLKGTNCTFNRYNAKLNEDLEYFRYGDTNSKILVDIKYPDYKNRLEAEKKTQLALAEILLAIVAIYRPDLAAVYIKEKAEIYPEFNDMLPGIELDVNTDFGLSKYSETFYKSGLTMLELEENEFIDIRYREIDIRSKKEQKVIKNSSGYKTVMEELSTVINMITSENCDNDIIERNLFKFNNI